MILKRKLRYILVETSRDFDAADRRAIGELESALMGFMGEHQYADANFRVATMCGGNTFIASVNRGAERSVLLSLSFVRRLGNRDIGIYTIRTSGTMRKLLSECKKLYGG